MTRNVDAQFVAELDGLGFFRLAPPRSAEAAKKGMLEKASPLPYFMEDIGREFLADGEELNEGGIRDFLGYVAPFLWGEGVRIEGEYAATPSRPIELPLQLNPDPGRTLSLRLSLESGGDLVEVTGEPGSLMLGSEEIVFTDWTEATTQTVALLDRLLAGHGSEERAWLDENAGGNEGYLWFATDRQVALINSALSDRSRLRKVAT